MTTEVKVVWPAPGNTVETKSGMQYIIGQPINSGGYALVFEGHDLFGNAIALKVFKPAARPFEEVRIQWERECHIFE
jgi:serine/threonine protein kinase